jgi:ribulose 1,5-bisphosphate synthetase/thiazole synthase
MSNYLPVENGMENDWFCDEDGLGTHQTTASLLEESDIVIIGAGFAGVATACHLLKGSSGNFSVTILEARGACSGATGRNGGHIRPDLFGHIPTYIARSGVEAEAEIADFEVAKMWAVKKVIR